MSFCCLFKAGFLFSLFKPFPIPSLMFSFSSLCPLPYLSFGCLKSLIPVKEWLTGCCHKCQWPSSLALVELHKSFPWWLVGTRRRQELGWQLGRLDSQNCCVSLSPVIVAMASNVKWHGALNVLVIYSLPYFFLSFPLPSLLSFPFKVFWNAWYPPKSDFLVVVTCDNNWPAWLLWSLTKAF